MLSAFTSAPNFDYCSLSELVLIAEQEHTRPVCSFADVQWYCFYHIYCYSCCCRSNSPHSGVAEELEEAEVAFAVLAFCRISL
jgi:hypothetical protein